MPTSNPIASLEVQRLVVTIGAHQEMRLVVISGGQFIATCAFKASKHTASLFQLFVTDQYRHRGVGTLLVQECEALARRFGIPGLGLRIDADNLKVKPFYDQLGFTAIVEYTDGELLMWKPLAEVS